MHDTKIGIIVRDNLETWQKLNVTAFLMAGIAASVPEIIGEDYEDGTGNIYLPLCVQPVFVYTASSEHLQRTCARALSREIPIGLYTKGMVVTDNDKDNRAVVKAAAADDLDIAGLAFRCECKTFDKIVHGLKLHP